MRSLLRILYSENYDSYSYKKVWLYLFILSSSTWQKLLKTKSYSGINELRTLTKNLIMRRISSEKLSLLGGWNPNVNEKFMISSTFLFFTTTALIRLQRPTPLGEINVKLRSQEPSPTSYGDKSPGSILAQIDGLVQDCSISSALVMEILQSGSKPSK